MSLSYIGIALCLVGFLFLWFFSNLEQSHISFSVLACSFICLLLSGHLLLLDLNLSLVSPFNKENTENKTSLNPSKTLLAGVQGDESCHRCRPPF